MEIRKGKPLYVVDARKQRTNGKRKSFSTREEAEKHAQQIGSDFFSLGKEGTHFPTDLRVMAEKGAARLEPFGKSLQHAVDFYVAHLEAEKLLSESKPVEVLVDQWLAEKCNNSLKQLANQTKQELKKMASKLKARFGCTRIASVTTDNIESYLRDLNVSNQTKKNILVKWGQFFNWAIHKKFSDSNPCHGIEVVRPGNEIERYSASEVKRMFRLAEEQFPQLLPYLSICTFAGVRPSECEALTWEKVSLASIPPQIEVSKSTLAVKDYTRFVTIEPNLLEWLKVCHQTSGPIASPNHRKRFDAFKIACGFKLRGKNPNGPSFIPDGLRHTFASYWKAKYHDLPKLASEMGNSIVMIKNHYNRAVRPDEVTAFWEIVPFHLAEARRIQGEEEMALTEAVLVPEDEINDCDWSVFAQET